ncbi:16S rRNA (guanine966-N2)-methyltransferase [Lachnospiraceae bacterium PFB1-21]
MRVIAGSAKSLKLKTAPGLETRPTQDRIKETLFNMISQFLIDAKFLDLFAGSGGIGIEALSRGAREAVFLDKNKVCTSIIKENLEHTHLEGKVLTGNVLMELSSLEGPFDIIFMDPPYNLELEKQVLEYLANSNLINEEGLIIVEADLHTDFSYLDQLSMRVIKEKRYKTNKHVFIEMM